jgi:hypothetical protein
MKNTELLILIFHSYEHFKTFFKNYDSNANFLHLRLLNTMYHKQQVLQEGRKAQTSFKAFMCNGKLLLSGILCPISIAWKFFKHNFNKQYVRSLMFYPHKKLYIGIFQHKEHPPKVWQIRPGTPCIFVPPSKISPSISTAKSN